MRSSTTFILLLAILGTAFSADYSFFFNKVRDSFLTKSPQPDSQEEQDQQIQKINGEESGLGSQEYNEKWRNQFHFSPPIGWINDPNGMIKVGKVFHLYFQYNPYGNEWDNMSWGHATSVDLVHWTNQPVAMYPTDGGDVQIYSGSCVNDIDNTAGFGENALIAIWTGETTANIQDQRLSYSFDEGLSYEFYDANPVIDKDSPSFRDPHVFWYEGTEHWVMIVSEADNTTIDVYLSEDLKSWELASTFGPQGFYEDCQWEDPQLISLRAENSTYRQWILSINCLGGTTDYYTMFSQYFNVDFNGTHIKNLNAKDVIKKSDYGSDFYEVMAFTDYLTEDGDPVWLAWMQNNWYAWQVPTEVWRGSMTIPRSMYLKKNETSGGWDLVQQPVKELEKIRKRHIVADSIVEFHETERLKGLFDFHDQTFELKVKFKFVTANELGVKVYVGESSEGQKQETIIGYNRKQKTVFVDRSLSGYTEMNRFFPKIEFYYEIENDAIDFHIFVDRAAIEVFVDGGVRVMAVQIFPDPDKDKVALHAPIDGIYYIESFNYWHLNTIWDIE